MSIFDGIGSILAATFGDTAVVTPASTGVAEAIDSAIFRFVTIDVDTADGRNQQVTVPVLRIPADAASVYVRGDAVTVSDQPGKTFTILDVALPEVGAVDGLVTYRLEETP